MQDLLKGLLERDPAARLGMEMATHSWLASASPLKAGRTPASSGLANRIAVCYATLRHRRSIITIPFTSSN